MSFLLIALALWSTCSVSFVAGALMEGDTIHKELWKKDAGKVAFMAPAYVLECAYYQLRKHLSK